MAQSVWLYDNGYPQTAGALRKWANGEISAGELRRIAEAEVTTSQSIPSVVVGPATIDVPSSIVDQVLAAGNTQTAGMQATWLNDNGYPQTAAAIDQYTQGNISEADLRRIAETEFASTHKPNA